MNKPNAAQVFSPRVQCGSRIANRSPLSPAAETEKQANESEPLLTIDELAAKLGLKRRYVEKLYGARKIPVVRINRRVLRFRWRDVQPVLATMTLSESGFTAREFADITRQRHDRARLAERYAITRPTAKKGGC